MEWLVRAGCLPVLIYALTGAALHARVADSGSHKNAHADRVE
jgi:hypothetical protein